MGYVYMLGEFTDNGEFYKIGVTKGDIHRRIKKLQTGNPNEIFLVDYFETDYPFQVEHMMHLKYFSKRESGEWYAVPLMDKSKFREYCKCFNDKIEMTKNYDLPLR